MKFDWFGFAKSFKKFEDLLVGGEKNVAIKIRLFLIAIAEFVQTAINLDI